MMKRVAAMLAGILLAACGGNVRTTEMVQYDFGDLAAQAALAWPASRIPIAAVEVRASSWLSGPVMHYRLAYAEPLRRQGYAESRWAAPPAELLEAFLKRRIIFGQPDFKGSGCGLQLVIDEFEQRFDEPLKSQLVLDVRALLTPLRGGKIISRKTFQIRRPAAAANARGGAAAARDTVHVLADELGGWLDQAAREKPSSIERCST